MKEILRQAQDDSFVQERRDECRQKVLEFLALRQAVAHHPRTILRKLNEGHVHDFTLEEIEVALAFRVGAKHVEIIYPEGGSTKYYKATSTGVLANERGEETL